MSYLPQHALGAFTQTAIPDYQGIAKRLAAAEGYPYVVVTLDRTGGDPSVIGYMDRGEATDLYGSVTGDPGNRGYVAVFDKADPELAGNGGLLDEATFTGVISQTTSWETLKNPVLVAVIALGVGAMLFYKPAKKKRIPTRRRARRARWRS